MIAYVLIIAGFMMRILPHAPNMVPVAAIALFAGSYLDKKTVPWIPLAIMVASDLIIGFHKMIFFTWGAFILVGFIGMWLKGHRNVKNIAASSMIASVLFFLITNFGVWLVWYPHTAAGFTDCFVKALPFFRNSLAANIVYTFVVFGIYESAKARLGEAKYRRLLFAGSNI